MAWRDAVGAAWWFRDDTVFTQADFCSLYVDGALRHTWQREGVVWAVAFSPGGATLAGGGQDRCGPKVPAFLQTWWKVRLLQSFVGVRVTNVLPMREGGNEGQATDLTLRP